MHSIDFAVLANKIRLYGRLLAEHATLVKFPAPKIEICTSICKTVDPDQNAHYERPHLMTYICTFNTINLDIFSNFADVNMLSAVFSVKLVSKGL